MIEYLQKIILGSVGRSVIRRAVTVLGGILLGLNVDPAVVNQFTDSTTTIAIALLSILLAQGWSLIEKKVETLKKVEKPS